jgi:hypothetical protein
MRVKVSCLQDHSAVILKYLAQHPGLPPAPPVPPYQNLEHKGLNWHLHLLCLHHRTTISIVKLRIGTCSACTTIPQSRARKLEETPALLESPQRNLEYTTLNWYRLCLYHQTLDFEHKVPDWHLLCSSYLTDNILSTKA